MQLGIVFANSGPHSDPDAAVALARLAEDAGYDSLWTVEHVVVPAGYESQYPYSKSGRMPGGEESDIPDPLIWLAFVAAATSTIKLATGILILPQRNPLVLAKEAATLDVLSKGRFVLGVGVGWLAEEFDLIGVSFKDRAAITDEYIAALRAVWTQDPASFDGRFASFSGARSHPRPVTAGGPPIVIGGHSPAAARRAGRLGDGFFPAKTSPDELVPLLAEMRRAAEEAGRDPGAIEVTAGGAISPDDIARFAEMGVHRIVVPPLGAGRGDPSATEDFLRQVAAAAAAV